MVVAFLAALVVWWLSTGAIIYAVGRSDNARRWPGMLFLGLVSIGGFAGLLASAPMETVAGAYLAFASALAIWTWHETTFLTGALTGPRRTPCPPGLTGAARFRAAFNTIRDHELAILASAVVIVWMLWDAPNQVGLWTFMVLWGMRISAKLNIFQGAPNAISEMMPDRLAYLTSYFRTDRISGFFPVSIMAATIVLVFLCDAAFTAATGHEAVGFMLVATFMGLAIAEHFFLVLPIRDSALWAWALPKREDRAAPAEPEADGTVVAFRESPDPQADTSQHHPSEMTSRRGGMSWT